MNGTPTALESGPTQRQPRQRSSIACSYCHRKRIRCNASDRRPCSNCNRTGHECLLIESKRGKNRKATSVKRERRQVQPAGETASEPNKEQTESEEVLDKQAALDNAETTEESASENRRSEMLYAEMLDTRSTSGRRNLVKPGGQVVYLGETFNLTYLLEQSQPEPENRSRRLHYALPTEHSTEAAQSSQTVEPLTLDILKRQSAFVLPPEAVCSRMFEAYFQCVQPHYPIIEEVNFLQQHSDLSKPPSWLLLQAVLFMAAGHCDESVIRDCGFKSRADARLNLFRRTKAFYDADHENDKVTIVQALFLMSFWWATPMDEKDTWHWLGNAISLALTLGMHRSTRSSEMDVMIQRLWKRVWWSLFTEDKHAAAALGRPVHIRQSDCDVEPLEMQDFEDPTKDAQDELAGSKRTHALYVIHLSRLSKIVERIIEQSVKLPGQSLLQRNESLESCEGMLLGWKSQLPVELQLPSIIEEEFLWKSMLHVAFQ